MRGDNIEYVPHWVYRLDAEPDTWTSADPLTVEEPHEAARGDAMSTDALLGIAVILIGVAIVGHLLWHLWEMPR